MINLCGIEAFLFTKEILDEMWPLCVPCIIRFHVYVVLTLEHSTMLSVL